MDSAWISVEDKLPLEKDPDWPNVIGEYLVTVELDNHEPCDDREVMLLWFCSKKQIWFVFETWEEYNWGWYVTHWMEKPKPAK